MANSMSISGTEYIRGIGPVKYTVYIGANERLSEIIERFQKETSASEFRLIAIDPADRDSRPWVMKLTFERHDLVELRDELNKYLAKSI